MDLCPECVQRPSHGIDPVRVVVLVLPDEIYNDRAVRLAFLMRPGRVCRMVKHGLGERPHSDTDTVASIFCESLGSFLEYLGTGLTLFGSADAEYTYIRLLLDLIDDTRGELVDHDVTPPTTGTILSSFLKIGIPNRTYRGN